MSSFQTLEFNLSLDDFDGGSPKELYERSTGIKIEDSGKSHLLSQESGFADSWDSNRISKDNIFSELRAITKDTAKFELDKGSTMMPTTVGGSNSSNSSSTSSPPSAGANSNSALSGGHGSRFPFTGEAVQHAQHGALSTGYSGIPSLMDGDPFYTSRAQPQPHFGMQRSTNSAFADFYPNRDGMSMGQYLSQNSYGQSGFGQNYPCFFPPMDIAQVPSRPIPGFMNAPPPILPVRPRGSFNTSFRPRIKYEYCVFCKNNGEAEEFFLSHTLKDDHGKVVCPVLSSYRCPFCDATGAVAHTVKYCPTKRSKEYYADQAPITVLKQMRSSIGKPRSQPSVPVPMLAAAAGAMAEETSFGRSRFSPIGTPPKEHY